VDEGVIEIEVAERKDAKPLRFLVAGEVYEFRVPKLYGLMRTVRGLQDNKKQDGMAEVAMFGKIEDWLFSATSKADASRIRSRLEDPDDTLDVEHLVEVFQQLVKAASDRPTGGKPSA
jgi:hypothetical protein